MTGEETQRHSAADLLREIAAFVAEKDRLAKRVDDLLATNNATEEKRRIAVQELREARATVEAQGKMLVALQEQLASSQQSVPYTTERLFRLVMSECIERNHQFFPAGQSRWQRCAVILDAGIDLYKTLTDPMESTSNALKVFEDRLGLQPATSGAVQR
jgi:hypothetical protein